MTSFDFYKPPPPEPEPEPQPQPLQLPQPPQQEQPKPQEQSNWRKYVGFGIAAAGVALYFITQGKTPLPQDELYVSPQVFI